MREKERSERKLLRGRVRWGEGKKTHQSLVAIGVIKVFEKHKRWVKELKSEVGH